MAARPNATSSPKRLGYKYRMNPKLLTPEQKKILRKIDHDVKSETSPRRQNRHIRQINFDETQASTSTHYPNYHVESPESHSDFNTLRDQSNMLVVKHEQPNRLIVTQDAGLSSGFKNLIDKIQKKKSTSSLVPETSDQHSQLQNEEDENALIIDQSQFNNAQICPIYGIQIFKMIISWILMMLLIIALFCFVKNMFKHSKFFKGSENLKTAEVNLISGNVFNINNPPLDLPFEYENDINKYIEESLLKYDADKTLKSDFALESLGGKILSIGRTVPFKSKFSSSFSSWFWSYFCSTDITGARHIIQVNMAPGECWAFEGSHGEVTIKLIGFVLISEVSLEHIPASISPTKEISSAPRKFRIYGLKDVDDKGFLFGSFEYDELGKPLQIFKTVDFKEPFNMIKMIIDSNWGNVLYTCVYRIRIHGVLADSTIIA